MIDYSNRELYPPQWNMLWEQFYQMVRRDGLLDDLRRKMRKAVGDEAMLIPEREWRHLAREMFRAHRRGDFDQALALGEAQKNSKFTA